MTLRFPRVNDRIYLNHAASAPLRPRAKEAWNRAQEQVGNPSSRHQDGVLSRELLENSREVMKTFLGGRGHEVVFTSGGSEAIVLGILGTLGPIFEGAHVVATAIEHSAVLGAISTAQKLGAQVTIVSVHRDGTLDLDAFHDALRPDTRLACVQHANNETGVVQPVAEAREIVSRTSARLLVDAVQTAGKIPLDNLEADLLTVSAHKFGGSKGTGALRLAPGIDITPPVCGATHEGGRRAGTEDVAGAVAMAAAAKECLELDLTAEGMKRMADRRARWDRGIEDMLELVRPTVLSSTIPQTSSLLMRGLRGDAVADMLDSLGVSVGTGAACHNRGEARPSHVLTALGLSRRESNSAIRASFDCTISSESIDRALEALRTAAEALLRAAGSLSRI